MRIVLGAFDDLAHGETLVVTTDHEARPLRQNLDRLIPDQYTWQQRHVAIRHWEITLRRAGDAGGTSRLGAFFGRCALLCDAQEQTRKRFEGAAIERSYARDAAIVRYDEPWPHLGFVSSGSVVCRLPTANGCEQMLFDILPGASFGVAELLDGGHGIVNVTTGSVAATVVLIPREVVHAAMAADEGLARAIALCCAQHLRYIADRFTARIDERAVDRVASIILAFSSADSGLVPPLTPLSAMTQAELADRSGTAKEVAARAVASFETAGAIVRAKGHIALVDRQRLATFISRQ